MIQDSRIENKIKELEQSGYNPVYIWSAEPNENDPEHNHPFDVHLVVFSGEIKIGMDGKSKVLKFGESIDIPRNKIHWARAGLEGCTYVVAERH